MKQSIKVLFAYLVMMSVMAIADESQGFIPTELVQATSIAMELFKTANPDHIVHLSGFKTWKSGVDAKVKFYVAHDGMNMEYNYSCLKQENRIHCSAM
jgi:hypothetical protein